MAFEVPVTGVERTGKTRRAVFAASLALVAVVALAAATGDPSTRQAGRSSPPPDQVAAAATEQSRPPLALPLPDAVRCRDVTRPMCVRMAKAALLALPVDVPQPLDVTVWRSLLCNDSLECPPSYLDGSAPLGSVIVRFVDGGPRAAVNVVEGRPGPIRRAPRAWVVRWMPEGG